MSTEEAKREARQLLQEKISTEAVAVQLNDIDPRLLAYYASLVYDSEGERDVHNVFELLGGLKFLRLLRTYPLDLPRLRQAISLREGEWEKQGEQWHHVRGGLRMPGRTGLVHYRWEPFQVFMLAAIYGPSAWIDTHTQAGTRAMLETEREGECGTIEDLRRLCTDFTCYCPRKVDKTGFSAYTNFISFMLGDADAEVYCCANAQSQSKLLFDRTASLIRQLDPTGARIRFTATEVNWKPGQPRSAQLWALSAGGKTKDGYFAAHCAPDEFGNSPYVGGKSDMANLVSVIQSSMGPRREPLTVTTTTAGTIQSGPFLDKLDGLHRDLMLELDYASGKATPTLEGDRRMCLLLEPDEWERDEEYLFTHPRVRRKVNPMLGIIVQEAFYDQAIADSRIDPSKRVDTLTKLFNVYQTSRVQTWLTPDEIRRLQTPMRIDDLKAEDGWVVFAGIDMSQGDDLHTASYLCVNTDPDHQGPRFFADLDCWVSESTLEAISVRPMYERWIKEGWLHVSEGKVFQPSLLTARIVELSQHVNFLAFGYDAYQSRQVVNDLSAWIYSLGGDPKQYIMPVRQNFATYNPAVMELEYMVRTSEPWLRFSPSPLWPWQFGNVALATSTDGMENHKPIKATQADSCKVDSVQALLSALILYDMAEGKTNE